MRDLAPDIVRQRLLIEGLYGREITRVDVERYLVDVAAHLGLRTYGSPIVHAPGGVGKDDNEGFDAFIPLIDSGISLYVWSKRRFFAAVLFTYDGWIDVTNVAGEVRRPGRDLPLGLGLGVAALTVLYLVVNVAFLRVVPLVEMRAAPAAMATTVATASFGDVFKPQRPHHRDPLRRGRRAIQRLHRRPVRVGSRQAAGHRARRGGRAPRPAGRGAALTSASRRQAGEDLGADVALQLARHQRVSGRGPVHVLAEVERRRSQIHP